MNINFETFKAEYQLKMIEKAVEVLDTGQDCYLIAFDGTNSCTYFRLDSLYDVLLKGHKNTYKKRLTIIMLQDNKSQVLYSSYGDIIEIYVRGKGLVYLDNWGIERLYKKLLEFIKLMSIKANDYIDNKSQTCNIEFCISIVNDERKFICNLSADFFDVIIKKLINYLITRKSHITDDIIKFAIREDKAYTLLCVDKF